jgi:hypothetical protein
MTPKQHSREFLVQKAHNDIDAAILDVLGECPIVTYLELLAILNQISASWIKRAIQEERNPGERIGEK